MMMTMFPWIRCIVGGVFALLQLDRHLAFGMTLAAAKKMTASRFERNLLTPSSPTDLRPWFDIVSGLQRAGIPAAVAADNINVQL
jgi:hypothetical protein